MSRLLVFERQTLCTPNGEAAPVAFDRRPEPLRFGTRRRPADVVGAALVAAAVLPVYHAPGAGLSYVLHTEPGEAPVTYSPARWREYCAAGLGYAVRPVRMPEGEVAP